MNESVKKAIFEQLEREPFAKKFGMRLVELEEGYSRMEMTYTPGPGEHFWTGPWRCPFCPHRRGFRNRLQFAWNHGRGTKCQRHLYCFSSTRRPESRLKPASSAGPGKPPITTSKFMMTRNNCSLPVRPSLTEKALPCLFSSSESQQYQKKTSSFEIPCSLFDIHCFTGSPASRPGPCAVWDNSGWKF